MPEPLTMYIKIGETVVKSKVLARRAFKDFCVFGIHQQFKGKHFQTLHLSSYRLIN